MAAEVARRTNLDIPGFTLKVDDLAINQLSLSQLKQFLFEYAVHAGMFTITLVKENGQGYNIVLHNGGADPKVRIALVTQSGSIESSWVVRDVIEGIFANGQFTSDVEDLVNYTLMGLLGSVMLHITINEAEHTATITEVNFHKGNIWP